MIHCPIGDSLSSVLSIFWKKKNLVTNSKPLVPIIMIGQLKKKEWHIYYILLLLHLLQKFDIQMTENLCVIERKVLLLTIFFSCGGGGVFLNSKKKNWAGFNKRKGTSGLLKKY